MTDSPKAALIAAMRLYALACLRLAGVSEREAIRIMNQLRTTAMQEADKVMKGEKHA